MKLSCLPVVLLLAATVAHAQPAPPPAAANDPAELAYQEGKRLYDLQEWDAAIAKFKEAYRQRSDAASLFNIAQSYRLKGDCTNAVSFYKTYKRNFPTAENIPKVDKFVADLEPTCAKPESGLTAPPPTPPTTTTSPVTTTPPPVLTTPTPTTTLTPPAMPPPVPADDGDPGHGKKLAGYIVGGVGAAGVIGGAIFAVAASGKASDVEGGKGVWNPSQQSSGQHDARDARILFAVGGAGLVAGAILVVLGRGEAASAHERRVAVAPVPVDGGGAGLVLSGRF